VTATATFARYIALPVASAGILGGAALGLAGAANAGTYSYQPEPRPGIVAAPKTFAEPPFNKPPRARPSTATCTPSTSPPTSRQPNNPIARKGPA